MGTRLQGWLPQTATSAPEASPSPAGLCQACRPASGGPWELGQRQANHTHPEGPKTCPQTHLPSGVHELELGSSVPRAWSDDLRLRRQMGLDALGSWVGAGAGGQRSPFLASPSPAV